MDFSVVIPFLLWIMQCPEDRLPAQQRHQALAAGKSGVVRRALCRLTSKKNNRLIVDLIKALEATGRNVPATIPNSYWPARPHRRVLASRRDGHRVAEEHSRLQLL